MVKVRFNKQLMRRGKIIPVGQVFEIDEKELAALKKDGAVVVKEAAGADNLDKPVAAGTLPPVENGIDNEEPEAPVVEPEAAEEPKVSGKVSLADAAKPKKK